jgi:hypothetical protein
LGLGIASFNALNTEHTWNVIDVSHLLTSLFFSSISHMWIDWQAVQAVAKETNKTMAQVALRWLLQKPVVTAPIIGAKNVEQLHSNLGALGWELTPQQMEQLDKASHVKGKKQTNKSKLALLVLISFPFSLSKSSLSLDFPLRTMSKEEKKKKKTSSPTFGKKNKKNWR